MQVPGATEVTINSMIELFTVLKVGAANRSKEETPLNPSSSRSHALLIVKTQSRREGTTQSVGRLTLVDLAG